MSGDVDAAAETMEAKLREYAEWGGKDSVYAWALAEIERLRDALEVLATPNRSVKATGGDALRMAAFAKRVVARER